MKKRQKIIILLMRNVLLMSTALLAACAEPVGEHATIIELQESAMEAEALVEVVRGDIALVTDLEAWVGPKMEQLTFGETGFFGEYKVQLGDQVKKGDVLAAPAVKNLQDEIAAKQKELESLTVDYEYQKATLENQKAIAQLGLDRVYEQLESTEYGTPEYTALCVQAGEADEQKKRLELQLEQLQETYELELPHCRRQLSSLKQQSSGNRIVAPFDGTVVATAQVQYGERIDTNLYYVAVADESVTYARCEAVSMNAVQGMERIVFWKDGHDYEVNFVQRDSKFYLEMRGRANDNFTEFQIVDPDGELAFGDYGLIRMTSKHKEDVLLLPETAVGSMNGTPYVYRDVDGKKQQVLVETGMRDGLMVEILSGLEEGDAVYVQD